MVVRLGRGSSLAVRASVCGAALVCGVGVAAVLVGCGGRLIPQSSVVAGPALSGNWSFAAAGSPASGSQIGAFAGSLQTNAGAVSGTVHTQPVGSQSASGLCLSPSVAVAVTGSTGADGTTTLTSQPFANGSVLTVSGVYDAASRTLGNAMVQVRGGSCGLSLRPAVAAQYLPINGTYTGTFVSDQGVSAGGGSVAVSAQLTQTSNADANGNFQLSGQGTFGQSPCVVSPVVTSSTVTGNSVTWTYTDATTGAQITASGTFNNDATVLTISSYVLSGGPAYCADTGHGTLHR